jgi:sulfur transfer complex TusBCD TusB component (DsrH family)
MSNDDVGPIDLIGFVETSDKVLLTFDFVAVAVEENPSTTELQTSSTN